jgi:hypothetical protein
MPDSRLCEVCSSVIPEWKAKNVSTCSVKCKFERRERRIKENREAEAPSVNVAEGSVLHHCLSNAFDPPRKFCRCRQHITDDEGNKLVSDGQAVHFLTRMPVFMAGEPLLIIGAKKFTPRVATLERTHCERITEKPARAARTKEKTIEELQAAVQQDKAERFEEEKLRLEIYGELNAEFLRSLVREVPAEQYDNQRQEAFGRPGIFSFEEERTSYGVDVVSLGVAFDEGIEIEETEPADIEDEIEVDDEQQNEDERTAEEVLAEYRGVSNATNRC